MIKSSGSRNERIGRSGFLLDVSRDMQFLFYGMLSLGRRLELLTAVFLLAFFSFRVNLA